jgi:predicted dehydrogenase
MFSIPTTCDSSGPAARLTPMVTHGSIPLLVLGAGSVVSEFYLPALAGLGLINGTTVIDRAPEQLSEIAKKWPAAQTRVGDFRDFLRGDLSAVPRAAIVALPNLFHVEACHLAIAAGYDVLCDKPLALNAKDCQSLFAASCGAGRIIDVNMCRRYLPSMVAIRRALEDDLIGDLVSIDVEDGTPYAWSPATSAPFHHANGGILADMGVHYLDLIEHLVGQLKPRAHRDDYRGGVEANAVIELETERGVFVRIALSRTRELRNRLA